MNITILKEEEFRSNPFFNTKNDMVKATIAVPKREWVKFKTHLKELERQEKQRAAAFAEIMGLDDD